MKHTDTVARFIIQALTPFRSILCGQLAITLLWAASISYRPYLLKTILNKIPTLTPHTVVAALAQPAILYVLSGLCTVIAFRIYDYLWLKFNPPLKRHVGSLLMSRLMLHSVSLFHHHFAGNLANKVKDVMSSIPDLVKVMVYQFSSQFFAIIIAIATVSTANHVFAMLLASWTLIFLIGSIYFAKKAQKLCRASSEIRSTVIGTMVDMLSNIASIHLFAAQNPESRRLRTQLDTWVDTDQKRDWLFLCMFAFQGFSFVIYQALCFTFLITGYKKGIVTAGDFALILTINTNIINTLWSLSTDILQFSDLLGQITQGLEIALSPLAIEDKPHASVLQISHGRIVFDRVSFNYKNSEPLFTKISLTIEPGQKVGLVGYSGSGKSTFINLILRLYDINHGHIYIDGQDVRDVTQQSLHEAIGMIPQDPSLFNRSVAENIRYGRPNATDQEIVEAAKKAHAHEFITELPLGYDLVVGERGAKLSGGQRQRIAIARAALKNAPILILDEATSQLDTITERHIQESLWELMQNKTTIVVAHRLSTLLHMDRIIVFDEGAIVEDATHYELLAANGLYKTLWDAQVDGILPTRSNDQESPHPSPTLVTK